MEPVRKQRTFKLEGEIDHHYAEQMRKEMDRLIATERPTKFILDFAKVTFMDSSGIGLIIGRYKKVSRYGGKVYAVNLNRRVGKIFRVACLDKIIKLV